MKRFSKLFYELACRYRTPRQVQRFVQSLDYNRETRGATLRSALGAVLAQEAHCIEGAFVAAAILEFHGYPPLICDLESKDGLDHVVYVFQSGGRWGAIGRSRDLGLEGRAPVFRSIRDLAWSYFDPYIDETGCLMAYELFHLDETGANWRWSPRNVWQAEDFLLAMPHRKLGASRSRYKVQYERAMKGIPLPPKDYWW